MNGIEVLGEEGHAGGGGRGGGGGGHHLEAC